MTEGAIHCTRTGCERTFSSEQGLKIHLGRAHMREDEREEDDAIRRAEEQPTEGDQPEPEPDEMTTEVEFTTRLEGDEEDLLDAVCFLYTRTIQEIGAEAMTMYFEWARNDSEVQAAVALRKKVAAA